MSPHRTAAAGGILLVVIAVAVGLYVAGSPAEQRLRRLDERRVEDLRRLASLVTRYERENGELPGTLDALVDGRRLSRLPRDPETGVRYDYAVTGASRFELCAAFSLDWTGDTGQAGQSFWHHGRGTECFTFDTAALEPAARDEPAAQR